MEALLDAINVLDLLSAHDLADSTSPLSAPDLHLLINRLEFRSLQIKSKVHSYLLSHLDDSSSLFFVCNDAVSKTNEISTELTDLLGLISDVDIKEIIDEVNDKMKEAKMKIELLELVKVILEFIERLKGAKEAVKSGRLIFAAEEWRALKKGLRIGDEEEKEPEVYGLLRKEWLDCLEEVVGTWDFRLRAC